MEKMSLRSWRLAREYTQEDMANTCEVHVNTYIAWEKEPEKIPVSKAMLIAKKLDVSIDLISFCSKNLQNVELSKEGS